MMDGGLKEDGSGVRSRAGSASTARALGAVPVVAFFIIHFLGWGVDLGAFTYECTTPTHTCRHAHVCCCYHA